MRGLPSGRVASFPLKYCCFPVTFLWPWVRVSPPILHLYTSMNGHQRRTASAKEFTCDAKKSFLSWAISQIIKWYVDVFVRTKFFHWEFTVPKSRKKEHEGKMESSCESSRIRASQICVWKPSSEILKRKLFFLQFVICPPSLHSITLLWWKEYSSGPFLIFFGCCRSIV